MDARAWLNRKWRPEKWLETEVSLAVGVTNPDSGVSGSLLGWNAQGPAVRRGNVVRRAIVR
jgi:hypothetical protein